MKKLDIYAMGIVFHLLSYFKILNRLINKENKDYYPKEMENIIDLMLKNNSKNLYNFILDEYIKNMAKITSIDCIFRCMYSFKNFAQNMAERTQAFLNVSKTPVSFNFANCIQTYFSQQSSKDCTKFLNNL